jgi:hypothetical protein
MWKVGKIMSVSVPDGTGYGFTVTSDRASPSCCLRTKRRRQPKPPHSRLKRLSSTPF